MNSTVNSLSRASEALTVIEAYQAMVTFLEWRWERSGKKMDDLAALLSDTSMDVWADAAPGDPAMWHNWLNAIDRSK